MTVSPPDRCEIDGCDRPRRKRAWCTKHYARWRRNGSPYDEDQQWVVGSRGDCVVCGEPVSAACEFRRYCGRACAAVAGRHQREGKARVSQRRCTRCGETFSLVARTAEGRLAMANRRLCEDCAQRSPLRPYRLRLIARGDRTCSICGDPVDVRLAYPAPMSPSVDHVIPRSLGGPDDMSNFALAHLRCNRDKRATLPLSA